MRLDFSDVAGRQQPCGLIPICYGENFYYLKIYKNNEHSSLELFYSVIYYVHKGGMTNVKRKNKISIKSISS